MSTGFEIRVGRVERLGQGGIGRAGLVSGWSDTEDAHVWNDGATAVMIFGQRARPPALTLRVAGAAYLPNDTHVQDIAIYVNGWWGGFWRMDERITYVLEVRIEPEWWLARGDRHVAHISFVMPNAARPSDLSGARDQRRLAFCFRTLEFCAAT
jgi:hypothetical protein